MHVLIYGDRGSIAMDRLRKAIQSVVSTEQREEFHTLESLSNGLRRSLLGRAIAVLLPASREDLAGLLSIRDLLYDILVILILPDRDKKTISTAHALHSRFLTFADSDFKDVAAVLSRMLSIYKFNILSEKEGG